MKAKRPRLQETKPVLWPSQGQAHPHESARAHVSGEALYVDDVPEIKGTLYAAPILSPIAHGLVKRIDTQAASNYPGVVGCVLAACLLYTSPSPRDYAASRMPSSA